MPMTLWGWDNKMRKLDHIIGTVPKSNKKNNRKRQN